MKKLAKVFPWIAVIIALAFLSGCAAICEVPKKVEPTAPPKVFKKEEGKGPVTDKPEPPAALPTTYTVEKCDDLYSISAKPQIYNDPWLWPLLFNANKDKIKNANKIKEGMVLTVPRDVSDADKAAARDQAKKFPKYVPPAGAKRYCPPK